MPGLLPHVRLLLHTVTERLPESVVPRLTRDGFLALQYVLQCLHDVVITVLLVTLRICAHA